MAHHPDELHTTPDERVTTEPQRKALDAMSDDLVRKLNAMVAEQEARARDFAAHQHSLSSLPQLPQIQALEQPAHTPAPPTITNGPAPDLTRHQTPKTSSPPPYTPEWEPLPPTTPAQNETKETGIGAGTIVFIIFVLLIILRNCG